jgi:glycosyltransferase involved in cell wall biosynthesis
VWLGASGERVKAQIDHDLSKLGLKGRVHFVGHKNNAAAYMSMFDMLCLTSREDPFPLVMLEAAALEKPIICFDTSGGGPEFVEDDCGFVVPYMDFSAMAARVVELADNDTLRRELGRSAQAKVRERHDVTSLRRASLKLSSAA